jgi:hypothetical protein
MIRPFTVLCLLSACGAGLYLYSEKHRTELLDRDIGRVIHATEAARARTGLLHAEWALLNEPGRLEDMAGRYLTLHPMAPTQFVQLAELATHLPAPNAAQAGTEADDDEAEPAKAPDALLASVTPDGMMAGGSVQAEPAPGAKPEAAPAKPDLRIAPKVLASASTHPHAQHHVVLADRAEQPMHGLLAHGTPLPLAAPQPVGASVYSAMARPMRMTAPRPTIVSAVPSYAPARSYAPSVLGGGASLPPPVPYGQ